MNGSVIIEYHGAALFKITSDTGKKIVIDPYIADNPMCKKGLEYFCDADLLMVTHGAFDHLGDAIEVMKKSQAKLLCGMDVARYALEMGITKERVLRTGYGNDKDFGEIHIKTVYALHNSRVETARETLYGTPLGFIVTMENGTRIYHAGDTAIFGDFKLIGMLYRPDIFLVGIAGVAEDKGNEMTPGEAALAALWVSPDIVVPMHYPPGSGEPAKFREAVSIVAPNVKPVVMEPGSQINYTRFKLKVGRSHSTM